MNAIITIQPYKHGGLCPRFKWSAVQAWLEEKDLPVRQEEKGLSPIAPGYLLGKPRSGQDTLVSEDQIQESIFYPSIAANLPRKFPNRVRMSRHLRTPQAGISLMCRPPFSCL